MACEKCDIWQHVDCLSNEHDKEELYKRKDADEGTYDDYEFICTRCKKKAKEAVKAEAAKSKEEREREKREREREINRAKYERRKIREKAKKEEERRKREEEARLAMQNAAVTDGTSMPSPSGEAPVSGGPQSSAPVPATDRAPMSTGQVYATPRHTPPSQYPPPKASPSIPYTQQTIPNQNTIPAQYPHPLAPHPSQHRPIPPTQSNMPPPGHYQPPPPHLPPVQQPRPSQYQPLRPAVAPYFSQYTTSNTLPTGQVFPEIRPPAVPYSNGINPLTSQARSAPPKPAPIPQYRPLLPQGIYPPPQQYQPPPLQPRLTTSPELNRSPVPPQALQHPPAVQPRPSMSPEIHRSPPPPRQDPPFQTSNPLSNRQIQPKPAAEIELTKQSHAPRNFSNEITATQSGKAVSPPMKFLFVKEPHPQLTFNQHQGLTRSPILPTATIENGSKAFTAVGRIAPSAETVNCSEKVENRPPSSVIVNGVEQDKDREGSSDLTKESERTKMSFLLN